jgi:hypothetical protein
MEVGARPTGWGNCVHSFVDSTTAEYILLETIA